jgi:hypothetical protein
MSAAHLFFGTVSLKYYLLRYIEYFGMQDSLWVFSIIITEKSLDSIKPLFCTTMLSIFRTKESSKLKTSTVS